SARAGATGRDGRPRARRAGGSGPYLARQRGRAMIRLTINERAVEVPAGTTVWQAARDLGIDIPVLCHSPPMQPVGVCRMCVVDVGGRVLAASCVRPCEEGMKVVTHSERVEKQRRVLTELLLAEHPTPCEKERTTGDCELEALARRYDLSKRA